MRTACLLAAALCSVAARAGADPRIAVFRAAGFPTVDAPALSDATLDAALAGLEVETLASPAALTEKLKPGAFDVLVLPYGSAFPLDAWPALRGFVQRGGGLVVLGGAPFHQPVRIENEKFVLGLRQPTFAHDFLIGPAESVLRGEWPGPLRTAPVATADWKGPAPEPSRSFALTIRLATRKDFATEGGSAGPRDGVVRPLVHVVDALGLPRQCPLLEIDRLQGDDAGARWVLAPSDAPLSSELIRSTVERALQGAGLVEARPLKAALFPGETASLRILVRRPRPRGPEASRARVEVRADDGRPVFSGEVALQGPPELRTAVIALRTEAPLPPGLYHATVDAPEAGFDPHRATTGFWVRDDALLLSGPRLSASRDWLRKDGAVLPVVGTTYMASDVHRKFLFEPNPHAWDADFREMAKRGVSLVRTGLWTAWSRAMLDPGAVDENVLAALDAYLLSAAKHGIHVCFNFYAFTPPLHGGSHPYLDPRAREGQRAFLALFAQRYRGVPWVHWDLINEPSYAPPDKLWTNQPVRDRQEARAWEAWLVARHGDAPVLWRELWRDKGDDLLDLPAREEQFQNFIRDGRRPRKAFDFALFSQDVVRGWAAGLRDVLKAAGGDVLVTLGQDEGGTADRPAPQFFHDALDYTAVHTWWNSDDLLWDGVVTKVPEKANLHQETGLMGLEDLDGWPWRSPDAAADLLERKFAYAFASRGTGVIEWAWNINPYMPIDNEARIGFFRPDGTAKPELRVLPQFAEFFRAAAPWLDDFEPDPVVLVLPHSRLFAGRPGGLDATRRTLRLLAERFGVVPTALSELRLTPERLVGVKLAIVPTPEMLDSGAAAALAAARRAGTRLLITGAVEGDPYGRVPAELAALGIVDAGRPLALHEPTRYGGFATFDGLLSERLRRAARAEPAAFEDGLWHEPLPLEFAREPDALAGLLGAALEAAGVPAHPSATRVAARVLLAPKALLAVCVNETPLLASRVVRIAGRPVAIPVEAGRSRLVLFERSTGRVLAATPGAAVEPKRRP